MINKNLNWFLLISLIAILFISSSVLAREDQVIDPEIPESWYERLPLASEAGITEFNQSPMLDKKVEQGELPPVEERLPKDPAVIEPYKEIGNYGGTITLWDTQLDDWEYSPMNDALATRKTPSGEDAVPYYIKDYDYSDDYKSFTIYLREGVKWSDGEPLTAEDYLYWWEYYANNEDLSPTPPENWDPPLMDVTSKDDLTVTFHYSTTNQFAHWLGFSINMGTFELGPAHYMKQFHPEFVDEEELVKKADEVGLNDWIDYYGRIQADSPTHPEYEHQRPVLTPYIITERSETNMIAERNPYYPFIDPEGNQLPYVDKLRVNLANSFEMANTKAVTGEATIASRNTQLKDIPLYKRNEENEDYTTLIYRKAFATDVGIMPNMNHKDSKLRAIFQDDRFRKALSLAIDRDDINNKIYFQQGIPMQNSIVPTSDYYKEEYGRAYAEYDPERAAALLDEMGMVDRDGDGYRDMPEGTMETMEGEVVELNGEKFKPTFVYCKAGPVEPTPILELVTKKWDELGLNVNLKMQSRELINERHVAGDFDISFWTVATSTFKFLDLWHLGKYYAPTYAQSGHTQWPLWNNWFATDGETGVEPPEFAKKLNEYANIMVNTTDEEERAEMAEKILQSQAENVWNIGTVGMGPQAVIVKNDLKNIPVSGLWDSNTRYLSFYRPEQFYLEE